MSLQNFSGLVKDLVPFPYQKNFVIVVVVPPDKETELCTFIPIGEADDIQEAKWRIKKTYNQSRFIKEETHPDGNQMTFFSHEKNQEFLIIIWNKFKAIEVLLP